MEASEKEQGVCKAPSFSVGKTASFESSISQHLTSAATRTVVSTALQSRLNHLILGKYRMFAFLLLWNSISKSSSFLDLIRSVFTFFKRDCLQGSVGVLNCVCVHKCVYMCCMCLINTWPCFSQNEHTVNIYLMDMVRCLV